MEKLEERIRTVWIVQSVSIGLLIGLIISGLIHRITGMTSVSTISMILIVYFSFWYSSARYCNWAFDLKQDYVHIQHGVFRKVVTVVPHVRIQHIDTDRGPLERVLGLASAKIYTAGSRGADISIPGLKKERAEEVQEQLRKVAIESEKGFDGV